MEGRTSVRNEKKVQLKTAMEKMIEEAPPWQAAAIKFLGTPAFDYVMGLVIVFNMVVMIVETDRVALEEQTSGVHWTEVCGWIVLVVFLVELCLRLFAFRCCFWKDSWNVFDFAVVLTDGVFSILGLMLGNLFPVSILRVLRLAKLARISKVLRVFPELRMMVAGLAGSVSAIFWGFVLLCLLVMVWSIVAVQFIHPWNKELDHDLELCPRCPRAFSSVMNSALTIWQTVIAGDSWGVAAIPILDAHPASSLFFLGVSVTIGMGVLNLILGVVCNVFTLAHDRIQQEIVLEERVAKLEAQQHLRRICESLDTTGCGELTQQQMRVGFDVNEDFHHVMEALDVTADDLEIVWTIIDTERSGAVSYQKFVDQVYLMKDNDTHFMLAYIKYYITKIKEQLLEEIKTSTKSTQRITELEAKMFEKLDGEEKQVERMVEKFDEQDTPWPIANVDKIPLEARQAYDVARVRPAPERPQLQDHSLEKDVRNAEVNSMRASDGIANKSQGGGAAANAVDAVELSKVAVDADQELRRKLQKATSETQLSLDKHICEINVLIAEMLPVRIKM